MTFEGGYTVIVNDINITGPFQVYAVNIGHYVFSWGLFDRSAHGDIPPDVARLPVLRTYFSGPVLIIETEV